MGLAASQARLLGIGSKKANAEWQGQQINQTRTALANETANLWQKLLNMKVPNAPKVTDYSTTQYSFNDGNTTFQIDSVTNIATKDKYNAKVKYKYFQDGIKSNVKINANPEVQEKSAKKGITIQKLPSGSYLVIKDGEKMIVNDISDVTDSSIKEALVEKGVITSVNDKVTGFKDANGQMQYIGIDKDNIDENTQSLDAVSMNYKIGTTDAVPADKKNKMVDAELKKILELYPDSTIAKAIENDEAIYTFSKNGIINYACIQDLQDSIKSSKDLENQVALPQYAMSHFQEEIVKEEEAIVERGADGRLKSVALKSYSERPFTLHTESTTNDSAYDKAMKEFNDYKNQYEATIEEISQKTKKIQEQDRHLELRLKNLDTERTSLQTEIETIKKIMEKKVDEVFKTFQ